MDPQPGGNAGPTQATAGGAVAVEDVLMGCAPKESITTEGVQTEGMPTGGVSTEGVPAGGVSPGGLTMGGVSTEGMTTGGVSTEGMTIVGVSTGGVSTEGLATGGMSSEGMTTGGMSSEGMTTGGMSTEGVPAGGVSTKGMTTGGVSPEDTTTGGMSTEGMTTGCVSTEGMTIGGVSTEGMTTGGVSTEGMTTGGVSTEGMTTGGVSTEGMTIVGVSTEGMTPGGVSTEGMTTVGMSTEGVPAGGVSTEGMTTGGVSTEGVPAGGVSTEGMTTGAVSTEGLPFQTLQDTSLQMLSSIQPTLADPISGLTSPSIPLNMPQGVNPGITVAREGTSLQNTASHPNFGDEVLRTFMQNLVPLQPTLTLMSQCPPVVTPNPTLITSPLLDTNRPLTVSSPLLTTFPQQSQFMLLSSPQLLPLTASPQLALATPTLPVTTGSLPGASQRLLTLTTPQLTMLQPQQTPLIAPIQTAAMAQAPTAGQNSAPPTTSLVNPLEEATREIREGVAQESLQSSDEPEGDQVFPDDLEEVSFEDMEQGEAPEPTFDEDNEYEEEVTRKWSRLFKEKLSPYFGYVTTLAEAAHLLKMYERCTHSKFYISKKCSSYEFVVNRKKARRFRYGGLVVAGQKVPFDNVPYCHGGQQLYHCEFGNSKNKLGRAKPLKHPDKCKQSKKVGCVARVSFRVIGRFPSYKLKANTDHYKLITSQKLAKDVKASLCENCVEWRVYVALPKASMHTRHEVISSLRLRNAPMDRRLVGRIAQLETMGIWDTATIQKQTIHFAETVLVQEGLRPKKKWEEICGTRQVWWYKTQARTLARTNKLQESRLMEYIQEVEELSRKHNYIGYVEDGGQSPDEEDVWVKRTRTKQRKSIEKQVNELKVDIISEIEAIVNVSQNCSQVEVLARLLNRLKRARETFERELNMQGQPMLPPEVSMEVEL